MPGLGQGRDFLGKYCNLYLIYKLFQYSLSIACQVWAREYWSLDCWGLSITPAMDNGKSGSLDTKTQFMAVYSISQQQDQEVRLK